MSRVAERTGEDSGGDVRWVAFPDSALSFSQVRMKGGAPDAPTGLLHGLR
ncbi:hypothetical protein GCM10009555_098320 [Acrocarpospora macrocephala]|uniref:Uncharacterized protein n=1 Tax=Acrocarpospora macrocephala TaxID=150177 RepID=A0A5M3WT52_9ACTN|nr:hypothetical protein [Acrocarpospora macrocephala]GES12587.1 hypothetical protein Amac_061840 [Acrocarpospora macrocephala]